MSEEQRRIVDLPRPAATERRAEEPPPPPPPAAAPGEDEPTLADYVAVVSRNRWLIAAATGAALALGALYLFLAPPVFRADVLIQVEEKSKGLGGIDELSAMFSEKTPAETEMEILRSRLLVGAVVEELQLDVVARPRTVPVLGSALARRWKGSEPAPAWLGLDSFAWGGERVRVDRLEVGAELVGERMTLVAMEKGRYRLLDAEGAELFQGQVGAAASGGEGPRQVALFVSELAARPGTQIQLRKLHRADTVDGLQKELRIGEKGKKTGIIQVALDGRSPARVAAILDSVSQNYLRQNVQRKSAEAEKTLQFVESQLPLLKDNLDRVEDRLNTFKQQRGSVDLTLETKGALDRAVEVEKALTELSLQRSELTQRFTESHPVLTALGQKREKLLAERANIDKRLKGLPEAELDAARLMRDVKTATELYFLLLNKAQELKVVKSGTIGNVRIIDSAVVPYKPVSPKAAPTLALALLLGLAVGVGAAFVRKALDHGVEDPDLVERSTGIPVYASVPHSARQDELLRALRRDRGKGRPVLAASDAHDLAVEALRSLRTALQFSLVESRSNVVAIVGAAPGAGKSFVAVNLAWVLADIGKKVLIVDADLRKGRLHSYFAGERQGGLSELIIGQLPLEQALRRTQNPQVDYVASGVLPPNPSELLSSERFRALVSQLGGRYDVVLVDTAPILAVTDGAIAGRLAGVSLMVLRSGVHPVRELALAAKRFRQNGVQLHGAIMNDVKSRGALGTYAYHYQYEYRAED